jgi:nodulation protein E
VVIGSGAMGQSGIDAMLRRVYAEGKRIDPLAVPRVMGSAVVSLVAAELGARGPAFAVTSACASAAHAIGTALLLLRSGAAEVAVTGGADACFSYGHLQAWEGLRVMAPDTCRPFSRERRGMVLGEGAAVFVLETLEHAERRGAEPLAELAGFGQSCDAGDPVHPDPEGMAAALTGALRDAAMAPGELDYVNAHGTGTPSNDVAEARALQQVLGGELERISISATKSLHGHALGASGALELVAALFAIREGVIPPTANWLGPDPECPLDVTPNVPRERPVAAALSSSFAFGGLNAVLALRRLG